MARRSQHGLEWAPPSTLTPWDRNPRVNDHAVETVAGLITRFGFAAPIVIQAGSRRVLAGHTRLKAALQLRLAEVPVRVLKIDDGEAEAYALADNRSGELADWDEEQLGAVLADLTALDVSLEGLGFTDEEMDDLLGVEPVEEPGPAPEPPTDPDSKLGRIYQLGPHRLMCGDATSGEDVAALLGGEVPNLMVTDPPYGVEYDPSWRNEAAEKGLIDHAAIRVGVVENDARSDWSEAWELFQGAVAYVWHAPSYGPAVFASLESSGFKDRALICWAKPRFAISRGHYHHQHEAAYYVVRKGKTASWAGDRSQTTLWAIGLDKNVEGGHSTQKPVECMERPIRNHEGDVYDPFLGSGTTLIAAARQGRRCYGLEISPAYCDVIRKRWGDWARADGQEPGAGAL